MRKHLNVDGRRPAVAAALRTTRSAFFSVALLSAFTNLLMLTSPLYMMQIYDRVLASRSVPTLVALSVLAIVLYIFLGILELIRARILSRIGERIEEQLGGPTFDAVMLLPLKMSKREVASQPVRDLEQMRQFMGGPGPIAICDMPWLPVYVGVLFLFHAYLGWLAIAGAIVLITMTLCSEAILRGPSKRMALSGSTRADFLEAGRRNAEALFSMGMKNAYARNWSLANGAYLDEQRRVNDAIASFSTFSKIFRVALQSAVLALGAWLAIKQLASPGAMIAASIITSKALAPIEQAIGQWRGFVNFRQAKTRLTQLFEKIGADREKMALPAPTRMLSVSSLAVAAPGNQAPTVRDVSFSLAAGQGLGIIGPSGSGKSTLVRALVGIWPAARGIVRLDGAELDQWHPESLGPSIGYLPQGVELFDGTIAENISRFSSAANPSDIIEAAGLADVHDLILSMPEGYDTRIGNGGAVLSAGQRQRIALARALFGKPFLIVLDEPNASLDAEGEVALTNAIVMARQRGAVVVIVAHRPNALSAVDQVLVLTQGAMAAFGPRDEVLRKTTTRAISEKA
ncbi:PrtD family type I secretion system ABC transporter [Agrobacterium pusense]|uniref:type I secretion system permease/ATPase n=1 Tax=Agrobacterium pusense TaxID=648995 RepID=UPI002857D700|nr:type I secretion system permease/ATPase [Agrobacterium pusense]MDR6189628.1 PrtD family type I secretion system ABC transporter [Agrobacterium pusense]